MKKSKIISQCMIMGIGMAIVILTGMLGMFQVFGEGGQLEQQESPAVRVANGNRVSCLNVWSSDGGASSEPMTVYYNNADSGLRAPQIIYLRDENVNTVFCIQYGSQLSSGNVIETCSEEAYQRLNGQQKTGISHVLGCAGMRYAPRDGEGGYNVRNTGNCTFQNFQLYNATQLMIWYYIDCYSDHPGGGNTGGITWDGVVRTCNSGWASLQECERIKNIVDHINDLPGFCGYSPEQAPVLELKYNKETEVYETIVTDTNLMLDFFQGPETAEVEWNRCNPDGSSNDSGNSILIRSKVPIGRQGEASMVITWKRNVMGSAVNYLVNQNEPQDLAFFMGEEGKEIVGYIKIITERIPTIEIVKKDADSQECLAGVTLQLFEGETLIHEWITTESGYQLHDLQIGHTYRLHEAKTLEGYTLAEDVVFTVDDIDGIQTVIMENEILKGSLLLTKMNEKDGTVLEGVTFELFKKADDVETPLDRKYADRQGHYNGKKQEDSDFYIGTYTTDSHGEIKIKDLDYGLYYFVEVKVPFGFQLSKDVYSFSIHQNETVVKMDISNKPMVTTEQPTTERPTTEQNSTEEVTTERATVVAGVTIWKETETPRTGDSAIPMLAFAGLLLSRILFYFVQRKKV